MPIMRKPDLVPVTLALPSHLVKDATLYAPSRDPLDAVCYVLQDYSNLLGDIRQLRRRVAQLDEEGALLDEKLEKLQRICREILDL